MIETATAGHGLAGGLQAAVLIATDGSSDWFGRPPRARTARMPAPACGT